MTSLSEKALCIHCGDPVLHTRVEDGRGNIFCCGGCMAVYAMLKDKGWDLYYHLARLQRQNPPSAGKNTTFEKFLERAESAEFLKNHGTWDGRVHSIELTSQAIVCSACGWLLEKIFSELPGMTRYSVDFIQGRVRLSYDADQTTLKTVLQTTYKAGYPLVPIIPSTVGGQTSNDGLLKKLVVAGACFINIMIFSIAGYAGPFGGMERAWHEYFEWFSLFLSLPVVFYSAVPFYIKAWHGLRRRTFHMDLTVSAGILITFCVSAASVFTGIRYSFFDSISGLVFFLLAGRWGVRRFELALASDGRWFEKLNIRKVRVVREDNIIYSDVSEIKTGDLVLTEKDDYLAVDGVLETPEAWIDTSMLTGENRPVRFHMGDAVYSGYRNIGRDAAVRVKSENARSRVVRLRKSLEQLREERSRRTQWSEKIAPWFTFAVCMISIAAFVFHWPSGFGPAVRVMVSILIVSCPCALALSVPLSRSIGLNRLRNKGFYIRNADVLQVLPRVRKAVFDKTGTLTYSRRTVRKWHWVVGNEVEQSRILPLVKRLCRQSIHPASRTVLEGLEDVQDAEEGIRGFREIVHFGIMAVSETSGDEIILCRYISGEVALGPETDAVMKGLKMPERPGDEEGVPDSCIFINKRPAALLYLTEQIKPSVGEMTEWLSSRGIDPVLLSGDNAEKVRRFAGAAGFASWQGGMSPEEKQEQIRSMKQEGHTVLAAGDGFNDSLLLGEADAGMVVHGGARELAQSTDILFVHNDFGQIKSLFRISESVSASVRNCYTVSLLYNAAAVSIAFAGYITPLAAAVLMPLSTVSVCVTAYFSVKR